MKWPILYAVGDTVVCFFHWIGFGKYYTGIIYSAIFIYLFNQKKPKKTGGSDLVLFITHSFKS